jgi:membrane protease YdiL (CAAX protease family)
MLRFFLTLFLGAMVVGPVLFLVLGKWVAFHKLMNRALLVCALAAMASTWSRLRLREWWPWDRRAIGQVLLGLFIAFISVQTILGLEVAFGGLAWTGATPARLAGLISTAIIAAILVPLTEETIFRGFLQTEFSRRIGAWGGWLLAALVFALSHFLKVPESFDHIPVRWWSGVLAVAAAVKFMCSGGILSGQGLNYFLIGLILGGIFWRTGVLWLNYGLHAGWIVGQQLTSGLTHPTPARSIWTGSDLLGSPLTTLVLVLLGFWLWLFFRRPPPEPPPDSVPGAETS